MIDQDNLTGHLAAVFSILVWGTTFASTKILLTVFTPIEILVFRFTIGFIALSLVYPKRLPMSNRHEEMLFMGAGLCGVTLYFLLENIALTYTYTSNVGVIISIAPFFTAILAHFFLAGEKLSVHFFIGFVAAIMGIFLISFNGITVLQLNPVGDLLAVLAALVWAIYSVLTRKISAFGYHTIQTTRRVFFYGLLFIIPTLPFFDFHWRLAPFYQPVYILNLLFLGLLASAVCFVTWNLAVKRLGATKTSVYIYMVPVITVVTSVIVLNEKITWMAVFGTVLTLFGLLISEKRLPFRKKQNDPVAVKKQHLET
ncbi:MAG: DMT family transporter [Acetobacterium sp.]|nr:DMT family transporter [Bacillota bacterium]MCG2729995.1 DMT family transporter [Acetobacterium sp.]